MQLLSVKRFPDLLLPFLILPFFDLGDQIVRLLVAIIGELERSEDAQVVFDALLETLRLRIVVQAVELVTLLLPRRKLNS